MDGKGWKKYSRRELSAFCTQLCLLLQAGVSLDEGFAIMAEDAGSPQEKEMLLQMSQASLEGIPLTKILEETEAYPRYLVKLAGLGYENGSLDTVMKSLAAYYEKEHLILRGIRDAVTYPAVLVGMLMVLLTVLFTKVMPVFFDVYEQLGVEIPAFARAAMGAGGTLSVILWIFCLVLLGAGGIVLLASSGKKKYSFAQKIFHFFKNHSKIAEIMDKRRFTAAMGLTLKSGLEWEKSIALAEELISGERVLNQVHRIMDGLSEGKSYYEAMKDADFYTSFQLQMIRVGARSGHLDTVMEEVAKDYEQQADGAIDHMVSGFEPAVVAVLAVSVGTVLLSIVLPLLGVLSAVG